MKEKDHVGTPWIGVDLDGTLAMYDGWKGPGHIGDPIPEMVKRVQKWLKEGKDVRVFTARVCPQTKQEDIDIFLREYTHWCFKHIGQQLPVTCIKDHSMVELWDDRAVQVDRNKGIPVTDNFYLSKVMSEIRSKNFIPEGFPIYAIPDLLRSINVNVKRIGWEECANGILPGGISVNWEERCIESKSLLCNEEALHEDWVEGENPARALLRLSTKILAWYEKNNNGQNKGGN